MSRNLLPFLFFFAILFAPITILAQTALPDTGFVKQSVKGAVLAYRNAVGSQAHLYNGPEYFVMVKPYVKGHQFFEDKSFKKGAVLYDGAWFYEVPMTYDVAIDEVVIAHAGGGYSQMLVKPKVQEFVLSGHTFVHLNADSVAGTRLQAGFYDLMYDGSVKMLVRRKKELQEKTTSDGLEGSFREIDTYYLWKNGKYYEVGSKHSVLKALGGEKKLLNKFARTNNLRFKKQREEAIYKITQYYDTL
ncbi:hypothetical protein [Pontibacter pudoricolor]|uniref:hypothetical protein n=1 Tax=Pontibacter pudoricolor TaxID=2694930 RepID=UPI0013907625|nr:hypothetical protein [Pontibacter pudoricolor]